MAEDTKEGLDIEFNGKTVKMGEFSGGNEAGIA